MSWSKVVPRATRMPGLRAVEAFSRHSFAPHAHDEFGLGMVLSGGHVSLSRVGRVEAEPRDVINVNPGEVHDGAPLGDAPRAWLMVYIDPPALAEGLGREPEFPDLNGLEFVAPVLRSPGLADKFGELYALLTQPAAEDEVALEGDLLEVLVRSLRPRARASSGALCSARVLRVLERMRDDPAAAVTLAD
ncbi:MAG: AraC family ligand binding domain-containing protein, partial [Myxococcota bacterium]